jgi:hypothetical protein
MYMHNGRQMKGPGCRAWGVRRGRGYRVGKEYDGGDDGRLEARCHTAACLGEEVQLGISDASHETASGTFQLPGAQLRSQRQGVARTLSEAAAGMALSLGQATRSQHSTMAAGLGSRRTPPRVVMWDGQSHGHTLVILRVPGTAKVRVLQELVKVERLQRIDRCRAGRYQVISLLRLRRRKDANGS